MVFKMSYGAAPPTAPAKPVAAAPATKKAPSRARKGGTLQEKAQALFEPPDAKGTPDQ